MNDKEAAATKARIERVLDRWVRQAGFGWWRIQINYERLPFPESETVSATTSTLWEYREARITFYLPPCAKLEDDQLELMVVHELCHLLVAPVEDTKTDEARARTELATTNVTNALLFTRDNVPKHAKRKQKKRK